ncbi:Splicing factor [Exophiala xenobiotica]|uniref:Splicing factor n=1 Tax=Lithohypha guttulata TaxID=1690604 RepID=A0ABR0KLN2_9EURO|nr:Splicing factor [Lithohypha guttulata]KAK5328263.1 Splicing factor [Exophiala xenobiotica]
MDLKSILSPSEENPRPGPSSSQPATPAVPSQTPTPPHKHLERTQSGPAAPAPSSRLRNATVSGSPLAHTPLALSSLPSHVLSPHSQPAPSPLISPVPGTPGMPHVQRSHSTHSMDTLGDLASMQSHQPARPAPVKGSSLESIKSVDSASRVALHQHSLTSNPRASFDINMMETPRSTRKVDFSDTVLPEEQKVRLTQLATYLIENPSAYESHLNYITILHQAFINHVYPTSPDGAILPKRDPATFDLLDELRTSRSTMNNLFAVGESIWLDWLQDESMLARSTEERIDVIEKFRKAVSEEASSSRLWSIYGDWVQECYRWANADGDTSGIDEDKLVGQEVFSWQMVQETWQEAVDNTKFDLAQSHLVWNKYIDMRIIDYKNNPSKGNATDILQLFEQRLRIPHVTCDSTKQILADWLTGHFSQDQYFDVMADTPRIMKDALRALQERSSFESKLEEAQANADKHTEYTTYSQYIEWEKTPVKRRRVEFDLCDALYKRAELRFPSDATLWEEHMAFMLENSRSTLELLSRATKHCPWAGSLWSQYLLASDRQGQSYEETEAVKHKATNTGILEAAGIEAVLKVHAAWCSYLRRRAFRPDRDEDDADIAEIGIRASMESISSIGAKLGIGETPDPSFRLQRIYINFLSESGRWDNARQEFDNAICDYGKSYQFWLRFYYWEMKRWRRFAGKGHDGEALSSNSAPGMATAVLKLALDQESLDYPEPIIEALIDHCEDYEEADELQACFLKVRKYEKGLAARRQIEAIQAAEAAAVEQAQVSNAGNAHTDRPQLTKRKRAFEDSDETLYEDIKRSKTDEDAVQTVVQTLPEHSKRDREHATVLVGNLPEHVSEAKVRQYFSNCGVVKALKMLEGGTSALVEFDDDQAAQYALSRDRQQFEDAIISVVLDTGSTVFLTNYAPETGENEIRQLLQKYGEIISVRLPSLQGNKKRRFCYVQFKLPGEAQDAVNNLDGKDIDGLPLTCKISNPAVKKERQVISVNDGRTIFVGGLNFKAKEDEVEEAFLPYGTVELMRMPLHETLKDRNKGIAFVTFSTVDEAKAALAMNGQEMKGRKVKIEIANDNQGRATRRASTTSATTVRKMDPQATSPKNSPAPTEPRSERTIFLTEVPDTINEARLRQVASKHGEILKCILKTNHQGALIEFAMVASAGEASLGLDDYEIAPGRKLKVVSEQEMKAQKAERKTETFGAKDKPRTTTASLSGSGFVKRPTQPGNRARKGGKLGQRSAMLHKTSISHQPDKDPEQERNGAASDEVVAKKSNADFRALMSGGSKQDD